MTVKSRFFNYLKQTSNTYSAKRQQFRVHEVYRHVKLNWDLHVFSGQVGVFGLKKPLTAVWTSAT